MALDPYRRLLGIPGVRSLLLVGMFARIPSTAVAITLTLHVVEELRLGFGAAGLVTAAATAGMAVGSPLAGRVVDRRGLRPVLAVTTLAQLAFWATAWAMPFPVLLVAAVPAGLLSLPVFSVIRQCLAALVPVEQRRIGFSLDSVIVELSYMAGPALAVAGVTFIGSVPTMGLVAVGLVASGTTLFVLNPPIRSAAELKEPAVKVSWRQWLTPALFGLLGMTAAATFVLAATELALVATMKQAGDTAWVGFAIALWCAYSLLGGLVYGMLPRGLSPLVLVAAMGLLTVPVGLVGGDWHWLILALLPAGMLCAPALSSTVDTVSRWVPAGARGEAMGLHGTALLIGGGVAAPIAGAIIDGHGPGWAFAFAGAVGVAMVLLALPFWRRTAAPEEETLPAAA
ncbi:MFS family permease [Streptosporangium becharense]|uniref:MFS family permease n=1 Tax=Streptosporangium becharense TaxID=1816182 RepID=A0A7W9MF00_9ACTN|nr:MFS transporter [Streptosporangium becharense]MBB2911955.1 MFS family permease [Streptosporangium becharense]MBB5818502.1 MFS family permease [Streptosporangium becharense]